MVLEAMALAAAALAMVAAALAMAAGALAMAAAAMATAVVAMAMAVAAMVAAAVMSVTAPTEAMRVLATTGVWTEGTPALCRRGASYTSILRHHRTGCKARGSCW